jgi:hypothetical protein
MSCKDLWEWVPGIEQGVMTMVVEAIVKVVMMLGKEDGGKESGRRARGNIWEIREIRKIMKIKHPLGPTFSAIRFLPQSCSESWRQTD